MQKLKTIINEYVQNEGCLLLQLKYRNRNNSHLYGKNCSLVCIINFMHC